MGIKDDGGIKVFYFINKKIKVGLNKYFISVIFYVLSLLFRYDLCFGLL